MAELPHARFYKGLPPVHRSRRPWLIAAAGLASIAGVVAVLVIQAHDASRLSSSYTGRPTVRITVSPMFDRYTLVWTLGAFIVGGVVGVALARGWWRMVAIDLLGLAIAVELAVVNYSVFYRAMFAWFFWVFGVTAGARLGRRIRRQWTGTLGKARFLQGESQPLH